MVMMDPRFSRTAKLIGIEGVTRLSKAHVAVFGLGGVGSYAVEALARAGVGTLSIFDYDTIDITNINRQIPALSHTVGRIKTEVVEARLMEINPNMKVFSYPVKVDASNLEVHCTDQYDYVIDAIDMVTSKILMIVHCKNKGIPIVSSMGTGNKLDPTAFKIVDIYKTHTCPLAKVMRNELKKRGVQKQKVLFSSEPPIKPMIFEWETENTTRRETPASISFVPSVAGLILAGFVIRELIGTTENSPEK